MVMIEKFINHQSTDFNTIQRELKKLSDEKDAKTVNAVSSLLKKRKRLQKSVTNKDDNIEDDDDEEGDNQDDGSENNMNSGNRKKSNRQISNSGNYSGKDLARDSVWIVANVAAAGLAFFNMP